MRQGVHYDVKEHHFNIPEIKDLCQAGAPEDELETPHIQAQAASFWSNKRHPKFDLAPDGWLPSSSDVSDLVGILGAMVDYAYQHVPMYREIYDKAGYKPRSIRSLTDFEKLPILTRSELNCWADDDRLSGGRKAQETYFVGTSGSSGHSLKV
ncbi:hypothetical protein [Sinorhizobium meliloti]|uniref:hypothetical protein n=1 Tax=Rhizobium meliloti TaxID=382 RepID=UPI000FD736F9|nr:hypothetical protein [Sinorhizobium meliloti]RVM17904.1 hypothetical protein CN134_07675 [Sinorhizobium meliloti]RVO34186.1 hypothetical protein CN098_07050 [Sinorhizobium meliloti]